MYFPVCCNEQLPPPPTIPKKKVVARFAWRCESVSAKSHSSLSLSKLSTHLRRTRVELLSTRLRSSTPLPDSRWLPRVLYIAGPLPLSLQRRPAPPPSCQLTPSQQLASMPRLRPRPTANSSNNSRTKATDNQGLKSPPQIIPRLCFLWRRCLRT